MCRPGPRRYGDRQVAGRVCGRGRPAWLDLVAEFERLREPLLAALFAPFPPVRTGLKLARTMGLADGLRFARFALQPVRRAGDELFVGEGAALLLAGNALHSDLGPEVPGSALYGWLFACWGRRWDFRYRSAAPERSLTR